MGLKLLGVKRRRWRKETESKRKKRPPERKGTEIQSRNKEQGGGGCRDSEGTESQREEDKESQKERNRDSTCGRDRHPESSPEYCSPVEWLCGWEMGLPGAVRLSTMSPPLTSPRLVLRAPADLVQGPGHLRNSHHGPCSPGLCGVPEGAPLPPGPGESPVHIPPQTEPWQPLYPGGGGAQSDLSTLPTSILGYFCSCLPRRSPWESSSPLSGCG